VEGLVFHQINKKVHMSPMDLKTQQWHLIFITSG